MELFALTLSNNWVSFADKLYVRLTFAAKDLHTSGYDVWFECDSFQSHTHLRCMVNASNSRLVNGSWSEVFRQCSSTLSAFILDAMGRQLLRDIVAGHYRYTDETDIAAIESYALQVLDRPSGDGAFPASLVRRQKRIAESVSDFLERNGRMNVSGFVHFRLTDYMEELREVAEYAIDEYTMDQQYQEFISLLKYFVYIQEAKIPVAHLIHRGGSEFTLYNEEMKPIHTDQLTGFTLELLDKEINFEDMIVSALISVSPQKIVIHTRDPEEQVIKTIMQIFENRVDVCTYCKLCGGVLSGKNKDQLYP